MLTAPVYLKYGSTSFLVHAACDRGELPLAGVALSQQIESAAVRSAVEQSPSGCEIGLWLGASEPEGPLCELGEVRHWVAYAGDPARWGAGISSKLARAGVEFVLGERLPDEWPEDLPASDRAWLLDHWLPLPVRWSNEKPPPPSASRHWLVVAPEGETEPHANSVSISPDAISPGFALVHTGLAASFFLRGPPSDWYGQLEQKLLTSELGFVAASCDPVVNEWLWNCCRSQGRCCIIASFSGSPARWKWASTQGAGVVSSRPQLRPFVSAWLRGSNAAEPRSPHGASITDVLAVVSADARHADRAQTENPISTLRSIFGVWAQRGGAAHRFVQEDPHLWFWSALSSKDAEARRTAIEQPTEIIADACAALARGPWSADNDVLIRDVEDHASEVWGVIDAALHDSGYDRTKPYVRKAIAAGLFMGAADALVLEDRRMPMQRAADWFIEAFNRSRDYLPDSRCVAIPSLLRIERTAEATQICEKAVHAGMESLLASALWRSFMMWLPVVESGKPAPSAASQWLSTQIHEAQRRSDSLKMSLAMCTATLRLYAWDEGPLLEPLAFAYRSKHAPASQVAAFALFCWLRGQIDTGLEALTLISGDWPNAAEAQFPIFCAHALLMPSTAGTLRPRFAEPSERFLQRGVPSHTRRFFWSLALAALGEVDRAANHLRQALQEDPLATVRVGHCERVGLKPPRAESDRARV